MPRTAALLVLLLGGCAYVLPASWRAYNADPDDAGPAVTRALDARALTIANWNQAEHKIVTEWSLTRNGVDRQRERYIISWEKNDDDGTLTVYVRHEVQDQELKEGRPAWTGVYHDRDKETKLLDGITKALESPG